MKSSKTRSKKKIVVLTGAGVSAESGVKTFRDHDGLWEEYDVMEVASIEGWERNPELVLRFYNERRKQLENIKPNNAHLAIAKLDDFFDVQVITQNVDDLHEKAGSKNIMHIHGELKKIQSSIDENIVYDIGYKDLNIGDLCPKGSQLRPNVVWFGEPVPLIMEAAQICNKADIFIIVGSSLAVYPAAGLINSVPPQVKKYLIDPAAEPLLGVENLTIIKENAGIATPKIVDSIIQNK